MKKTVLRVVSLTLLLAMLVLSVCACGSTNETEETSQEETEATTVLDEESDGLPERDYNGAPFVILSTAEREYYIHPDGIANNTIKQSVYERNLAVEKRFNVTIDTHIESSFDNANQLVTASIGSGDVEFDMMSYHYVAASSSAINGYAINLNELEYLDFSRDWWSDSTMDDLTINGRCYIAFGDFAVTAISGTFCMFYDRDTLKEWSDVNLDKVISDGNWTYEYMYNLVYDIYQKNGTEEERDINDFYGLATGRCSAIDAFQWAFDNPIYRKTESGELTCDYYSERLTTIYDNVYKLCYENPGVYYGIGHNEGRDMFASGNAIFGTATLEDAINHLGDYKNNYGIIPYPKLDKIQNGYRSMVEGGSASIMAPITLEGDKAERAGIIIEALCAETHKKVLPQYYDVVLKTRYSSSPVDAEMIDTLVASRIFDFGFTYDNWIGCGFWMENIIAAGAQGNITSTYERNFGEVKIHYETILTKLFDYDVSKIIYNS